MREGDLAPDFELPSEQGATVRLSEELEKGPVVLFFYPKAFTSGCTQESCHFRDVGAEFAALGARRLGISADPVERQKEFAGKYELGYPLLSDTDRSVARLFGVKRPGPLFNKRATFVIDTDRRILRTVHSEIHMERHADEALAALRGRPDNS
ncbi:MAG: peroxiredoxin [Actinomycetota bacterium]|nr:peroxiredoxin [Actinomycetota bacterium]